MSVVRVVAMLALIGLFSVGCSASTGTEVRAEVADDFSQEGLNPGDRLSGGVLTLRDGDEAVLEAVLDEDGSAVIEPEPGVYDVQVERVSAEDPLCFWGGIEFSVEFPSEPIKVAVGFICAGG